MHPPIEQMISDILSWLNRPQTLGMWIDPDSDQYCVAILGADDYETEIWRNKDFEKCLSAAWKYCDSQRKPPKWHEEVAPF